MFDAAEYTQSGNCHFLAYSVHCITMEKFAQLGDGRGGGGGGAPPSPFIKEKKN